MTHTRSIAATAIITAAAAGLHFGGAPTLLQFVAAAAALSLLAMLIGKATESMGDRLGPAMTGMLQSAFGNLPEIFVCIFSLRAGMVSVVQSALIGSILANALLVLGAAIVVGGVKHGRQRFRSDSARMSSTLMLLAVSALIVPTLAAKLHTPAALHLDALSAACAVVLVVVFALSVPYSLRAEASPHESPPPVRDASSTAPMPRDIEPAVYVSSPCEDHGWPLGVAITVLAVAGLAAAGVSDWFVSALEPTMRQLGISQAFAGFVIVAIAGNAVENVVGIQLAARNRMEYAMSVILNSSLQIALAVSPLLVLLSFVLGGPVLTLVLPPLLVAALLLTALITTLIVLDGETVWLEGVALIGLYVIIAVSLWWG